MTLKRRALRLYTRAYARMRGATVGAGTIVWPGALLDPTKRGKIELGRDCEVLRGAMLAAYKGSIRVGDRCSFNPYTIIYGHGGVRIGDDVRIAAHCVVVSANHVFANPDQPITQQGLTREGVTIENDVWIGAGARVLDGVTIARGCVVAAGAVISKSTEPFGVYGGVPARRIADR
ncbi:MAG: acyltransferase [Pseudomonadota bacterium]